MTKAEQGLVRKVLKELSKDKHAFTEGACFVTAQMAARASDGKFLYHEGLFLKPDGPVRHAWNTLNGKLVDFTLTLLDFTADNKEFYKTYYRVEQTFTVEQVMLHNIAIQRWDWIGK